MSLSLVVSQGQGLDIQAQRLESLSIAFKGPNLLSNSRRNSFDFITYSSSFVDEKDERKKDFDKLYGVRKDGYSADDSLISYEGFDTYEHYLDPIVIGNLDKLFDFISNKDIQKSIRDALYIKDADEENENSQYSFFPQIDNNGK